MDLGMDGWLWSTSWPENQHLTLDVGYGLH